MLRLRAVAQHIPRSILEPLLALDDGERREGLLAWLEDRAQAEANGLEVEERVWEPAAVMEGIRDAVAEIPPLFCMPAAVGAETLNVRARAHPTSPTPLPLATCVAFSV